MNGKVLIFPTWYDRVGFKIDNVIPEKLEFNIAIL